MNYSTFLMTRPAHQAKNLCECIESMGGRCIVFPTLHIEARSPIQIAEAVAHLSSVEKVIFTSSNAVYPVMPCWGKIKHTANTFAVGPGTAKTLADFGIYAQLPAEFNSEGLLMLSDLQAVNNQHIVVFSGAGGRDLLVKVLAERGAKVEKVVVYQRKCPDLTSIFPPVENVSLIISTSEESLKNLWTMAGVAGQAWLKKQHLLVISTKMQQLAQQLGFNHPPLVAKNASDAAILETLRSII